MAPTSSLLRLRVASVVMVTDGISNDDLISSATRIARVIAVWRDDEGLVYVLPPCGRCREFILQIDPANLETLVMLGRDKAAVLRDLLPLTAWPEPLSTPERPSPAS